MKISRHSSTIILPEFYNPCISATQFTQKNERKLPEIFSTSPHSGENPYLYRLVFVCISFPPKNHQSEEEKEPIITIINTSRAWKLLLKSHFSSTQILSFFPKHSRPCHNFRLCPRPRFSSSRIRATFAVALDPESTVQCEDSSSFDLFACPVCYEPLIRKGPSGFNLPAIYRSGFKCKTCKKSYSSKSIYLDLTLTTGTKEYTESKPAGKELFRSPFVSFVYENFNTSGFPCPEEEFKMAQDYFKPAEGGILLHVSCGSGMFSRKFAKSGAYSKVIALNFSGNMLRQCYDFIKDDNSVLSSNLALVRADISRLPFPSGSIDAVHSGAALHCWPSPSNAVAEINRVLRSGSVFVGSTFLRLSSSTPPFLRPFRQRVLRNYNYLTEEEIEDLFTSCGLVNYTKEVRRSFNRVFCSETMNCFACTIDECIGF